MLSIILVAAGSGKRMQSSVPKQFIELKGKSILERTLESFLFLKETKEFIIVLHQDYIAQGEKLQKKFPAEKITIAQGGDERFHSVQNALEAVSTETSLVLIHDGVRPFVPRQMIEDGIACSLKNGCAIPAIDLNDTIRKIESSGQSVHKERKHYRLIQTPQIFNYKQILASYNAGYKSHFTDDASVFEHAGGLISLYNGDRKNIKITQPEDLDYAHFLLEK